MARNNILPYNPRLKMLSRELRKNMTLCEVLLWKKIRRRALGYQIHRQVPILDYIVDFYCHELKLALEVDGTTHKHPEVGVSDLKRQKRIEELGVRFLRFEVQKSRKILIRFWIQLNAG